jgi:ParB family chromosome partitioning protein
MKTVNINLTELRPAYWNPNQMDETMMSRLRKSVSQYGLVEPLVVRKLYEKRYEVLSGNQRLKVLEEMGFETVPCVIVELDDTRTMLLAQALNSLHGEDDLALKGALLKQILSSVSSDEVLSVLPETIKSLKSLASINETDLAAHLKAWEKAQAARLQHMQIQLTDEQLQTVKKAVSLIISRANIDGFENPNTRGNAVFMLCKFYLERSESE